MQFKNLYIPEYLKRSILVAGGKGLLADLNDVEVLQGTDDNDCVSSTNLPFQVQGAIYASLG